MNDLSLELFSSIADVDGTPMVSESVCVSVMEKQLYHARPYAPKRYTRSIVLCVVFVTAADGRRRCRRHRVVVYFICSSRGFCRHNVFCRCCCSRCSF